MTGSKKSFLDHMRGVCISNRPFILSKKDVYRGETKTRLLFLLEKTFQNSKRFGCESGSELSLMTRVTVALSIETVSYNRPPTDLVVWKGRKKDEGWRREKVESSVWLNFGNDVCAHLNSNLNYRESKDLIIAFPHLRFVSFPSSPSSSSQIQRNSPSLQS